jgi:type 1 glutamine amidotransferase
MALTLTGCLLGAIGDPAARASADPGRILVFSKTTGFRHDSIPVAIAAIESLATVDGLQVDATEDSAAFTPANLSRYRAVVFLLTTGDVLDSEQQRALEGYLRAGGGWVGVHSASDTEYDWPWYGGLVGAYFAGHPSIQQARVGVSAPDHPATRGLPDPWFRVDEWYDFRSNPRGAGVEVLLTVDETSYAGGQMGADHPIAWAHAYDGGRAFYTAGGHTEASYAEPSFRAHLLGGLRYAVGGSPTAPTSMLLSANRFRVAASWRLPDGRSGEARFVRLGPDSAALWFHAAGNIEAVVKVLDGCPLNARFWVFAAGLTDVRVELDVTDTASGRSKRYVNSQGRAFAPIQDTAAFAGCP